MRVNSPSPQPGWAIYLRTSTDENQKPELSRERQRFVIEENVLKHSALPVIGEYVNMMNYNNNKINFNYPQMLLTGMPYLSNK